jgi:aspartate/methionine/tyrosine aminotransferase
VSSAVRATVRDIQLPPFDPLNIRAGELRASGHDIISLGQALPFFGPPDSALNAARGALDRREVNLYSTDPGLPSLRTALAERLAPSMGDGVTANDLIITAGGNHAFTLAAMTLIDPGDDVLLPAPLFTNHDMVIRVLGANAIEVPVADGETFAVRWTDIEPRLTPRTKALVLCTPSNPTGAVIEPEEGRRIVAESARRGVFVISDETYMHFVWQGAHWSPASVPEWRRNVAVVGTFSKSFGMMGWRVGYLLADAAVCAEAVKVQDAMIICAPVISQIAVEAAVRESWAYPAMFREDLLQRRQALIDGLAGIERLQWSPTGGAFFGFVRVDGCTDSAALAAALLEDAHVVTIPGSAFGRSGEGHLRLSYGAASVEGVREAMARIKGYFG